MASLPCGAPVGTSTVVQDRTGHAKEAETEPARCGEEKSKEMAALMGTKKWGKLKPTRSRGRGEYEVR